ncbi:MAG TPA: hypothetical protein DF613_01565 [Lachnospiraceae bacterium]|nr:hypothetical protein [Lachnospiraceae bacterium]
MKRLENIIAISDLWETLKGKRCFCFGAGKMLTEICSDIPALPEHINGIIDNNPALHYTEKEIGSKRIKVYPVDILLTEDLSETVLLITSSYRDEIVAQLERMEMPAGLEYTDFQEILDTAAWSCACPPDGFQKNKAEAIPRKIHYFWFSGNAVPQRLQRYIDGWKKLCPDFEMVLWNERNYDVSKNAYMKAAYENKRWGFVSDYARLDVIYRHGGIYMDTDVEMIRRPDELLFNDAYIGFERLSTVNTGSGFGARPGFPIIKELLDFYDELEFVNKEDPEQMTLCPIYETAVLKRHGLKLDGNFQIIDDMSVYPVMYFNAKSLYSDRLRITEETISVHHCTWTWAGEKSKIKEI